MSAVFKREFKSFFISPIGYIFLAIMLFIESVMFINVFSAGLNSMTEIFGFTYSYMLYFIPVLTMKTLSDDRRLKVDQALFTAPVSLTGIVLGKFFATFTVFLLSFCPTLVYQIIIASFATSVNWIVYIGNLLGVLLVGGSIIALGIFVSSLTENQFVSAVGTFTLCLIISLLDYLASLTGVEWIIKAVEKISFDARYDTFTTGLIDYSNIFFFLSFSFIFVFLTIKILEKRRYS